MIAWSYWGIALALLLLGIAMAIIEPTHPTQGPIHKLLYLHLPVAINALLASLVVCWASVGHIGSRRQIWDDLSHAGVAVTVLNATVLLLTGMFWAKVAWGEWWIWSPRLTFSLIFWALYVVILLVRSRISSAKRRAAVSSIYGVVAFLDVPLLYLSAKLLPDVHPADTGLTSEMYPTLWVWMAAITMFSIGTIVARFRLARANTGPDPETGNGHSPEFSGGARP